MAAMTLTGAIALVVSGSWLAVRLIVNPGSVGWLSWLLPDWNQLALGKQAPQTLADIEAKATQAGLLMGRPMYLSMYPGLASTAIGFNDMVLPLFAPRQHCDQPIPLGSHETLGCGQLVELRVYRPTTARLQKATAFELVDRITVAGPEELSVVAPLADAGIVSPGSTQALPLTDVSPVEGTAPAGVWLHLSGHWQRGSNQMVYGQVVRYDPLLKRLQPMLSWTSSVGQLPRWQSITGDASADLVVDQTIGLEPHFLVYQFQSHHSLMQAAQLQAIGLTESAIHSRAYDHALLLARNGEWSLALKQLQTVKQQSRASDWSTAAQAQLDLIALHARITKAQADRDWASPMQAIMAELIDGRWSEALTLLKTARANRYDIASWLTTTSDRLWRRVEAALRVEAHQPDLQRWGMLLLAVRQNREKAIAWLHQQPHADPQVQHVLALLDPLPTPTAPVEVASVDPVAEPASDVPTADSTGSVEVASPSQASSQIIGTAIAVSDVDPSDWLIPSPQTRLSLDANQTWYQVQVLGVQSGGQWQSAPFSEALASHSSATQAAQTAWHQLGFTSQSSLQIETGAGTPQAQTTLAQVRAIQIKNGQLTLLVAGDQLPASGRSPESATPTFLALLNATQWVQPIATLTLANLSQQNPAWTQRLVPVLLSELKQTGHPLSLSVAEQSGSTAASEEWQHWSVQLADLTGDRQPEAILTLQLDAPALTTTTTEIRDSASSSQLRTLIFSHQGTLLYSDLRHPDRSLIAMTDLGAQIPPALIIRTSQGYQVLRWSNQTGQFESGVGRRG
jgi:hypothetical protein